MIKEFGMEISNIVMKRLSYIFLTILGMLLLLNGYLIIVEDKYIPKTSLLILLYYFIMVLLKKRLYMLIGGVFALIHLISIVFFEGQNSDVSSFDFLYSLAYLGGENWYSLAQIFLLSLLIGYFGFAYLKGRGHD